MRLVILTGSLAGTKFEVSPIGLTVGRRPECELRFGDADNRVSGPARANLVARRRLDPPG